MERASLLGAHMAAGGFNPCRPRIESSTAKLWARSRTSPVRAGLGAASHFGLSSRRGGGGEALYRRAVPLWAGFHGCTPLPWHHPSVQMSQPAAKSRSGEQQPVHGSAEESSTPLIKAGSDFKQMCTAQLLLALLCAAARLGQFIGAASSVLVGSICADFVRWLV